MRIKDGYMLSDIADNYVIIPTGDNVVNFNALMTLNETGAFLWKTLENNTTKEDIINAVLTEYDIDEETAAADVEEFIAKLESINLIIE